MQNLPLAPIQWQRARLEFLLQYEPKRVAKKFQKDPKKLREELRESARQAYKRKLELKEDSNLADDQIDEIVLNGVAPYIGDPKEPLPEELELQIRDWFEDFEDPNWQIGIESLSITRVTRISEI